MTFHSQVCQTAVMWARGWDQWGKIDRQFVVLELMN